MSKEGQRRLEDANKTKRLQCQPPLAREEEMELARLALAGDVGARNKLVVQYLPLLFNTACRLRRRDADDLTSVGCAEVCRQFHKFQPERGYRPSAFLVRVARNAMIDHLRYEEVRRRFLYQQEERLELTLFDRETPHPDVIERRDLAECVWREVGKLEEPLTRRVMTLRLQGLTQRDTAEVVGRSKMTVIHREANAKCLLRKLVGAA
jgi:RNA polymerase sigma factor (sigma-70 family)